MPTSTQPALFWPRGARGGCEPPPNHPTRRQRRAAKGSEAASEKNESGPIAAQTARAHPQGPTGTHPASFWPRGDRDGCEPPPNHPTWVEGGGQGRAPCMRDPGHPATFKAAQGPPSPPLGPGGHQGPNGAPKGQRKPHIAQRGARQRRAAKGSEGQRGNLKTRFNAAGKVFAARGGASRPGDSRGRAGRLYGQN